MRPAAEGRGRVAGLSRSSWDGSGEVRRLRGTADVGEGPRRGDRVGRRSGRRRLVAAWREVARRGGQTTRMELRRRRLDAEERHFSPGRDAARGSAARTLEVGSARPGGNARIGFHTPVSWASKWRLNAAGGEGGAAGTACRAGEVDGEPRRRTRARAGRGSTRGRGRGWRGGARVRASEQGARVGERAGAGWATSRRRVGDDVDLNLAKGVICWGMARLVPAGLTSRH